MNTDPSPAAMAAAHEMRDFIHDGEDWGRTTVQELAEVIDRHCPTAALHEALVAQERAEQARYDWNDHGNQMEEWDPNLWFMENKRLKEALDTANTKARDLRKAALAPTTEV